MSVVNLSSYNNNWYKPGSFIKRIIWYYVNAFFFNSFFPVNGVKIILLQFFGAKVGTGVVIKPHVNIKYPWFLKVGNNVWIGEGVWIDNLAKVVIGNNVCISQGALLLTGNHDYKKSTFDLIIKEIHIHDGVWIGAKAIVCPGVICDSHAVLSVSSVATTNLSSYSVYSGNPASKVKDRIIVE